MTPEPFIIEYKREKEDEFIIVATDGLWNVFQHQEACDIVRQKLKESVDKKEIGPFLIEEAIRRKTTDNVSVALIFFQ